jgi:hypothetical protein
MPLALWTLIWLNFLAVVRKTFRQLRTVRGIAFFLVGLCVVCLWIGPSIFLNSTLHPRASGPITTTTAPAAILLVSVLNLLSSAGERAVTFTPAEVDFLFTGPFTRRQLLIYKLIKTGLAGLLSALVFGAVLGRLGGTYVCRAVGVWLLFQFLQLLAMIVALVQTIVGERIVSTGRRWLLIGLGIAVALGATQFFRTHHELNWEFVAQVSQTPMGQIVLTPFRIFSEAMLAPKFLYEGLHHSVEAAGIDLIMAAIVISLDANYLETAATASAKRYDRIARVRRSGLAGTAKATSARLKITMLPFLGGAGPIIWRQSTTAIRTARSLLTVLLVMAVVFGMVISRSTHGEGSIGFVVGICLYMTLILSQMLKFDFRGDLDHLDVLRSLPLRPSAVAAAQLVTPAVVLTVAQLALLTTISFIGQVPKELYFAIAAFALPINLLTLGVENLMFLLFPFRPTAAVAGDMTMMGRRTVVFAFRLLTILIVAGIAGAFGALAWLICGRSIPAGVAASWILMLGGIALIVYFTGMVYDRFDPSLNTPL